MPEAQKLYVATMPLTARHYWIVFVASLGQLIGTTVATIAGIIIPMINILTRPELSSFMQGLIGAADLIGIMVGSVLFGRLSDKYGYLLFFRLCPFLVLCSALVAVFVPNVWVLVISLFIIGIGIGGEYSLDSNYVSELMPIRWRRVMLGITKAASALGNIIAAALALWWVMIDKSAGIWPDLMYIIAGVAL
ncbi:MAG: MFS transporter, partial [Muribaculaceae bacterium]|nr:MFS transporter [Muribaculaceae bacterium]